MRVCVTVDGGDEIPYGQSHFDVVFFAARTSFQGCVRQCSFASSYALSGRSESCWTISLNDAKAASHLKAIESLLYLLQSWRHTVELVRLASEGFFRRKLPSLLINVPGSEQAPIREGEQACQTVGNVTYSSLKESLL